MPRAPKLPPVAAASLATKPPNLFIGTSGWSYATWKPGFYPPEVSSRGFLHYYASQFPTVEVNHTFRKLPETATLQIWLDSVPPGFRFSFKAPETITHRKRLIECDNSIAEFVEAILPARAAGKLAAMLFQLPPNFKVNNERLAKVLGNAALRSGSERLPVAVEFRNASWFTDETYAVLREHNAALCVADSDDLITPDVATARFRYYRFRQNGGYSAKGLGERAQSLIQAAKSGEAFVYLKHEDEPTGALNALALKRKTLKLARSEDSAQ